MAKSKEELLYSTVEVNGEHYYQLGDFADLTNRTRQSIRLLIFKGNRLDKLRYIKLGESVLIKASELTRFPFCEAGRSKRVTFFDKNAQASSMFIEDICEWYILEKKRNRINGE